jgi:hypothetical protein
MLCRVDLICDCQIWIVRFTIFNHYLIAFNLECE